jgi:hypothetical protein
VCFGAGVCDGVKTVGIVLGRGWYKQGGGDGVFDPDADGVTTVGMCYDACVYKAVAIVCWEMLA